MDTELKKAHLLNMDDCMTANQSINDSCFDGSFVGMNINNSLRLETHDCDWSMHNDTLMATGLSVDNSDKRISVDNFFEATVQDKERLKSFGSNLNLDDHKETESDEIQDVTIIEDLSLDEPAVKSTKVNFPATTVFKVSVLSINVINNTPEPIQWNMESCSYPYHKIEIGGDLKSADYSVFWLPIITGRLKPDAKFKMTIEFAPMTVGHFTQEWNLVYSTLKTATTSARPPDRYHVHTFSMSGKSKEIVRPQNHVTSTTNIIRRTSMSGTTLQDLHGIRVIENYLNFGYQSLHSKSNKDIKICLKSKNGVPFIRIKIIANNISLDFSITKSTFIIENNKMVKCVISYTPRSIGIHSCSVTISTADKSASTNVFLKGTCIA